MIVVEESANCEELELASIKSTPRESLDVESPVNPYLLSPWRDPRDTRKHSLPSQQVTEGITASQVRRLSERGGEGSGPTPKEAAFLATLSQAPAPSGRRHSVVTISKVPQTVFGRCRRESVAAYPMGSRYLQHSNTIFRYNFLLGDIIEVLLLVPDVKVKRPLDHQPLIRLEASTTYNWT